MPDEIDQKAAKPRSSFPALCLFLSVFFIVFAGMVLCSCPWIFMISALFAALAFWRGTPGIRLTAIILFLAASTAAVLDTIAEKRLTDNLRRRRQEAAATNSASTNIQLSAEISRAISSITGKPSKPLHELQPPARTLYPTQRDQHGVQFWLAEDRAQEVIDLLTSAYGPPKLIQTNRQGLVNAAYTVAQTGVALSVWQDKIGTNALTHIIISEQPPKLF